MSHWYERLESVRMEKGISQGEFADLIGIDSTALSRYEAGKGSKKLTSNLRLKLFHVLDEQEINYIEYGDNIPSNVISQSGSGNTQVVGNRNKVGQFDNLSALDRELISLLEHAPSGFKKKVIAKLKEYRDEEF